MTPEGDLETLRDIRRHLPFKDMPEQLPAGTLWLVPATMDRNAPTVADLNAVKLFATMWEPWPTIEEITSDPGPTVGSYGAAITYDLKFGTHD